MNNITFFFCPFNYLKKINHWITTIKWNRHGYLQIMVVYLYRINRAMIHTVIGALEDSIHITVPHCQEFSFLNSCKLCITSI
ncbi:hypothetical protein DERP_011580 [Dermatophagoides pteronyssinus]|uniref:Uncharacterized protein n=1 Tax=Dermatophagoides pteronyssinus TaxID=6956 RepID=A0ABQ8JXA5_DERPT|nr:hypothetical protein DERP_011580 [Dermatophagoides pteronyssinus]